jgi:hypothetical protein
MLELADAGDAAREDVGCGVLYGVLRDSAYKLQKLAEAEQEAHLRKGGIEKIKTSVRQVGSGAKLTRN